MKIQNWEPGLMEDIENLPQIIGIHKLLREFLLHNWVTASQLEEHLPYEKSWVYDRLKELSEAGIIEKVRNNGYIKRAHYIYRRTSKLVAYINSILWVAKRWLESETDQLKRFKAHMEPSILKSVSAKGEA